MVERIPWDEAEVADLLADPYNHQAHIAKYPHRTRKAIQIKRALLGVHERPLVARDENDAVLWDKQHGDVSWRELIEPLTAMQETLARASSSQDEARIVIPAEDWFPLACISDFHIGSWGISYRRLQEVTDLLLRLHERFGLRLAVLGDMLQMSIKLRNVLEIGDNALPTRVQMKALQSWVMELAPLILWSTHDNHSVEREEAVTGFSWYAEIFKDATIYHSGIGHTDLVVGDVEYKIASAHRFRGRSVNNPLASQMNYLRREAPDRDVVVAGDSHQPAIMHYVDGGKERVVANCGTLQTNSGYAKRYFSLFTSDAMPVIVFSPDHKRMATYFSLEEYSARSGLDIAERAA